MMQFLIFLWIALCLIVDTSTKSVRSTYNETGQHGNPLKSRECDCGDNTSVCFFTEEGKKYCICNDLFAQKEDKCEECDCGDNANGCSFNEKGIKECNCKHMFDQKGEKCEVCDCGENSYSCNYENGEKVCKCNSGYEGKNGKCENTGTTEETTLPTTDKGCDCGENSWSCQHEDGKKVCDCLHGYADKNGQCEYCYCGERSIYCQYQNEEKVCYCSEGYIDINGQCEKIPFPSTVRPIEITFNSTRNSYVSHSLDVTTLNRTNVPSTSTVRPTGADPCIENPCLNGGTCVFVDKRTKCLCRKPYLGILCETDPCDWNPCRNGGVCKIEKETVKCYCKQPFAGEFCESPIKIDAYVVTLVAASVFSAIVLIFVTCVMCQRYHVTRAS